MQMNKSFWLNKWESDDIPFHRESVNPFLVEYFESLNLKKGDGVFVPLCGKTKDMIWLEEQGMQVVGVEFSEIACRDFFAERNIEPDITYADKFARYQYGNITLLCGDFYDLKKFDLLNIAAIYDCKSLIALPPKERPAFINHQVACFGGRFKTLLLTRETSCTIEPPPYPTDQSEIESLYHHFNVQQLARVAKVTLPQRLIDKGYTELYHGVYLITE